MSFNNVVPLFPSASSSTSQTSFSQQKVKSAVESSSEDQTQTPAVSEQKEPSRAKSPALDLDTPHPDTGIKYGGFMQLRCLFFSPAILKALSPGESILYLYLTYLAWRYPNKPGCVRAALPYLMKGVGMGRSSVHSHLKRLEGLGFIECVEVNYKEGNLYKIHDLLLWIEDKDPELPTPKVPASKKEAKNEEKSKEKLEVENSEKSQQSGIQTAEKRTAAVRNPDGCSSESGRHPSGKRTEDYTSLYSSILSYTLSPEISETLKNYLSDIKAYKKETERGQAF